MKEIAILILIVAGVLSFVAGCYEGRLKPSTFNLVLSAIFLCLLIALVILYVFNV